MTPLNSVKKKGKVKESSEVLHEHIHSFVTWCENWIEKCIPTGNPLYFNLVSIESDLVHYTGNKIIFVAGPINKQ